MKKIRLVLATFLGTLFTLLPLLLTQKGHCAKDLEMRDLFAGVYDLRREINLLNLINGLHLSPEQITQMLKILREVEGIKGEYQSKAVTQARQMEEILIQLREVLGRNEEIDQGLIRKFLQAKKRGEDLKEEFHGAFVPYGDEMRRVLNENQLALIDEFKPCVVPPQATRNPVRIGQASGDTRMGERFLTRVRQMDEDVYQRRNPLLIRRLIERVERRVGLFSDEERVEEERRVANILKRARELSDLDFEARKADLARELKEPHEKALESRHRKRRGDLDKLAKFLLDPKLIPILEKRLTQVTLR
ncbi:MAG: hypothetical protein GTO13_03425 [Proteobacteria bacterium]|nr:hypothetical protein [Pseudomonadota bacterium]